MQENWNSSPYSIRSAWIKSGYQQHPEIMNVYKLINTEQFCSEWKVVQDRSKKVKPF